MATKPLKIGISARIDHPQPGQAGLRSKTLQYLEQSVAHWAMSRDVLVFVSFRQGCMNSRPRPGTVGAVAVTSCSQ